MNTRNVLATLFALCSVAISVGVVVSHKPPAPQVLECHGMNGPIRIHATNRIDERNGTFTTVDNNGVRQYFQKSLDQWCFTHEEDAAEVVTKAPAPALPPLPDPAPPAKQNL